MRFKGLQRGMLGRFVLEGENVGWGGKSFP